MRTTLDIEEDVLAATKALAQRQRKSAGAVLSELARRALTMPATTTSDTGSAAFLGFDPLPARGVIVTDELIDRLREDGGE